MPTHTGLILVLQDCISEISKSRPSFVLLEELATVTSYSVDKSAVLNGRKKFFE